MKRDMELVRSILLALEEAPFDGGPLGRLEHKDHTSEEVSYHLMLLHEAGLIHAFDFSPDEDTDWVPGWLTWAGHEFLDAARDNTRWKKALALVKNKGGGAVFEVLKQVLVSQVKEQVLGPTAATP